jgi:hypothetical protein
MIDSTMAMKPTCASSCSTDVQRRLGLGAGIRGLRQQARRLQLLAAQADHHHLAAEIGVER